MIDSNLLFWLEVCALTVLVGVGTWRIYHRTQQSQSAAINASEPAAHDMRQDRQRLSLNP
jgi:ABC-type nickel/cobalt efflux system permease component RcnA